jgi:steroid 5-alpha reductase family enzyme
VSGLALFLLGLASMLLMMLGVWALAVRLRNAGIVDVAWAGGFSVLALLYAGLGPGDPARRALIAAMTVAWSLRLSLHLGRRVYRWHPEEDGRYVELRRTWGERADRRLLGFFLAQGVLDSLLSLPILLSSLNPSPRIHPLEWAGLGLWSVALWGEWLADRQLERFKADPRNAGRTCQTGLWGWSRHPNYFFEWLVWCAYGVFALASPWGLAGFSAPLLILYFLLRVTGIPATEAQALRSRGEAYRRYQETTSRFVPWPPLRMREGRPPGGEG